jgi:ATP-dependent Clp protease ATP-binding subunit ClpC
VLARLQREVLGQPAACAAAADVVVAFKAGLNDPRRPLGVLLFCGPTGVGKTELAKALARCVFGGEAEAAPESAAKPAGVRLLRLDMSEYSGPWAADRLLLQPDGEPSNFLQQIRRQPFTVVLFDEIEKAHPAVFDVLLNVFDEGQLTDRFGRVTWFRSAVLILTSNLGVQAAGPLGFGDRDGHGAHSESAVREFFRPEFFNRLDSVVTFSPLTGAVIESIAEKELRQLAAREGLRRHGVQLRWTPAVVEHLARAGFDPRYGARPLQGTLETEIVVPLSRFLVAAHPRPRAVTIDFDPQDRIRIQSG